MPRYFFHTQDGDHDVDREGQQLPSDDAALTAAVRYAGSMLKDQPDMIQHGKPFCVTVVDEGQRQVATIVTTLEANPVKPDAG